MSTSATIECYGVRYYVSCDGGFDSLGKELEELIETASSQARDKDFWRNYEIVAAVKKNYEREECEWGDTSYHYAINEQGFTGYRLHAVSRNLADAVDVKKYF